VSVAGGSDWESGGELTPAVAAALAFGPDEAAAADAGAAGPDPEGAAGAEADTPGIGDATATGEPSTDGKATPPPAGAKLGPGPPGSRIKATVMPPSTAATPPRAIAAMRQLRGFMVRGLPQQRMVSPNSVTVHDRDGVST
jgi:hypothetical protein